MLLFRPDQNIKRLNRSCERMSMPPLDEELVLEALTQLVELEKDWVPKKKGTSLYIRPFVIATEPSLGVKASRSYTFMIVLSPVGSYYGDDQLKPVRIYVEDEYVRAVNGGVGFAKRLETMPPVFRHSGKRMNWAMTRYCAGRHRKEICGRSREHEHLFRHKRGSCHTCFKRKHFKRGYTCVCD